MQPLDLNIEDYRPLLIDTLKTYLLDNLPAGWFEDIFIGDPLELPVAMTPALIIEEINADYVLDGTGADEIRHTIQIKVVLNKNDEVGKDPSEAVGHRTLHYVIEGRDPSTNQYLTQSIMGILRTNYTLGAIVLDQDATKVSYQLNIRSENTLYQEGMIEFVLVERVQVQGRA